MTILFTFFAVPHFGLTAYIFGWLLSLIVVIALGMHKIRQYIHFELPFHAWFVKPLIAALIAGVLARVFADRLFFTTFNLRVGLTIAITLLGIIYLLGIMLSGCITKDEIKELFTR